MAGYPKSFDGYVVDDVKKWSDFKKRCFEPKTFTERDIDVLIECCGVCGSDVHMITGGWSGGELPSKDPGLCVGHEVIGKAIKVGSKVSSVKVGDRVGVGAQIWSCGKCPQCKSDNENYCPSSVDTYGAPYPKEEGGQLSQGGYASHIRANEYFVFPVPHNISSINAASMMCAGLTVYSPLVRAGTGPGKKVAIVGIGGLGHYALLWANALGAEVYAISHTPSKKEDALKLGAHHFIDSNTKDWVKDHALTFDFILNCSDMTNKMDVAGMLSTLKVNCVFNNVGLPDAPLPELKAQAFASNGSRIGTSHIGCRTEALAMLKLASEKNIQPYIETIDISEAGCKEAVEKVKTNDVRYRLTLTGFDKAFKDRKTSA
ncbi:MAG: hypothetical protein M1818_000078 [Claussenomyces sp. TS43310]|nr:MAG: hypothetical protein M1818_000078 [Claussenomyces sp. TS43310]